MSKSFLTDSHAHIQMSPLDLISSEVVARANEAGVGRIVTIGIDLADSVNAVKLANKFDNVYAAVGVHPHDAENFSFKELGAFEELLANKKVIAVGEIGLDYYRNRSPKDKQIEVFAIMLDMAVSAELPIIIHTREAAADTIRELDSATDRTQRALLHCFSGDKSLLEWGLAREHCLFSFAGNVTYPKAVELHEALKKIPLERLLIETDCPYLAPVPLRGKQNEPAYLTHTAEFVAAAKGVSVERLAEQLEANFKGFFNI
jgi:TatD DNase family protein